MNEKSTLKMSDERALEIYHKIIERNKLYGVPFTKLIKSYGLQSWSALKGRVERRRGKIMLDTNTEL